MLKHDARITGQARYHNVKSELYAARQRGLRKKFGQAIPVVATIYGKPDPLLLAQFINSLLFEVYKVRSNSDVFQYQASETYSSYQGETVLVVTRADTELTTAQWDLLHREACVRVRLCHQPDVTNQT